MNKLTKAAIAGGAGIILLMGGAGTFAVWNDSAVAGNSTITAGNLDIQDATGTWTVGNVTMTDTEFSSFRMVPGDTLIYTATFDVAAVGDNLTASLTLPDGAISAATGSGADIALAAELGSIVTLKASGVGVTQVGTSNVYSIDEGTTQVTVTATIPWTDGGVGSENAARNGAVSFHAFSVALTQTLP